MPYQPASANDLKFLVRSTLMADASVSAIVADRVHGAHIQTPDTGTAEFPLVVVEFLGGSVVSASGYQQVNADVWTYTRTSAGSALELYDAVHAALHQQLLRRDGVTVAGYSMEINRPDEGFNETVRAYYARGTYALRASYRTA
jgi:hypothetical protein